MALSARTWRVAMGLLMVGGLAFALRPLAPHQGPENWFPQADKIHHLWYFGLLWAMGLKAGFRPGAALALGLVAYGVGIEVAQSFTATRSASWEDLVADSTGVALAWAMTRWLQSRRSARQPEEHGR